MDHSMYLWMFILIGNAVAFLGLLSMGSGGTSAMGDGPRITTPRM